MAKDEELAAGLSGGGGGGGEESIGGADPEGGDAKAETKIKKQFLYILSIPLKKFFTK